MNQFDTNLNDYFTVTQVSNILNVTSQTIYNQLKLDYIEKHTKTLNGIKYISQDGINLIKSKIKSNRNINII